MVHVLYLEVRIANQIPAFEILTSWGQKSVQYVSFRVSEAETSCLFGYKCLHQAKENSETKSLCGCYFTA